MWRGGRHRLGLRLWNAGLRIDGFRAPGALYLLSHFHGDHMDGLTRGGPGGPIVASPQTARLLAGLYRVPPESVIALAPGETFSTREPLPLEITALDANHCPGAVMFLIASEAGRMLYTGDFRLDPAMRAAARSLGPVDLAVADNTYADPRFRFPSQEEAIERVVAIAERHHAAREVAVAVYSIGKTRILAALRERLGVPTYVGEKTARIYGLLGLSDLVTRDKTATPLRGYARGYFDIYFKRTRPYREGRSIAIIPTGWALDVSRPEWNFHYVPYSEHCDFHEREEFLALVNAGSVEDLLEPERRTPVPGAAPEGPAASNPPSVDSPLLRLFE